MQYQWQITGRIKPTKIVQRLQVWPLIASSTPTDTVTLSRVIWNLLSLSSCYNGCKRSQDEQMNCCWYKEACNINDSSESWNKWLLQSGKSRSEAIASYNIALENGRANYDPLWHHIYMWRTLQRNRNFNSLN
jgi:hypothetical protein